MKKGGQINRWSKGKEMEGNTGANLVGEGVLNQKKGMDTRAKFKKLRRTCPQYP